MKKTLTGTLVLMLTFLTVMLFLSFEEKDEHGQTGSSTYKIIQKWELPDRLEEVSGIEWMSDQRIAAVQDEEGVIFIFNLNASEIEQEIPFGAGGDYEGLSIKGEDAYVLRSDGTVIEIAGFNQPDPSVRNIKTSLASVEDIDVEGLTYEADEDRFLLAVKENKQEKSFRGVYAFAPSTFEGTEKPLFQIELSDPILNKGKGKSKGKFNPSEIEVNPRSKEFYILDARRPGLLIIDKNGDLIKFHSFAENDFAQPEGLTFSPDGRLYISNEAGDGPANILQVKLN